MTYGGVRTRFLRLERAGHRLRELPDAHVLENGAVSILMIRGERDRLMAVTA